MIKKLWLDYSYSTKKLKYLLHLMNEKSGMFLWCSNFSQKFCCRIYIASRKLKKNPSLMFDAFFKKLFMENQYSNIGIIVPVEINDWISIMLVIHEIPTVVKKLRVRPSDMKRYKGMMDIFISELIKRFKTAEKVPLCWSSPSKL